MEFRNLKEFHRCKALEDVNEKAFDRIVDNMAKVHFLILTIFFVVKSQQRSPSRCLRSPRTGQRS